MAQPLLSPLGYPQPSYTRLGRRPSVASLATSSVARTRYDRAQQTNEDDVLGYPELTVASIVAVPGLEAHPRRTWIKNRQVAKRADDNVKEYKEGPSCIADPTMLPAVIPNSRIMTFSYASDWRGMGKSEQHQPVSQGMEAVADTLLRDLKRLRKNCPMRPIIFLGHSLGGVIVEKIVVKSKVKSDYMEIYNSIAGCVFLGTPFKGTEAQARAAFAAKAGALFGIAELTPLLEMMKNDNEYLTDLLTDFYDIVNDANIQIFCFYELKESDISSFYKKMPLGHWMPATKALIADMDSSTLQGKERQPLNRCHFDLNKFDGNRDREWQALSGVISRMVSTASKALKDRRNALPEKISNERYLEILTTLAVMEADPDSDIKAIEDARGEAIKDSANLLLQNNKFKRWFEVPDKSVLWISLYPGMNSAIMAVALQRRVEKEVRMSQHDEYLCYFFCDSRNVKKNNTLSVLKAFIRQMLKVTQRLALHLPLEQQRMSDRETTFGNYLVWDNFTNLKLAFLSMLRDPLLNSVTLIVDSLHNIEEDNRHELLDLIEDTINIRSPDTSQPKVKWICLGLDRQDIKPRMQNATTITADDLGNTAALVKSSKTWVRDCVLSISKKLDYSREYTFWLRTELMNRAEGNDTWINLARGEIESVAPRSIDLRQFAENLKQDLWPLYKQIQARVSRYSTALRIADSMIDRFDVPLICHLDILTISQVLRHDAYGLEYTKEILRTMMILYNNPTLQELAVLSGLPTEIWDDLNEIGNYVKRCGSFLKIVRGSRYDRVHFMDTSTLDYLKQDAADELGHHGRFSIQNGIIALRCLNFMMNSGDGTSTASKLNIGYPKQFWLDHAREASKELPDLIEDFGLDMDFWRPGGGWWPKLTVLTNRWQSLNQLSILHLAAYFNFGALLDHLVADNGNLKNLVNAQDSLGRTALYWAAYEGHFDMVKKLVEYGAHINPTTNNQREGVAPLYGAAEKGHIDILTWLLNQGAVVDVPNELYGTALCGATYEGQTQAVKILLKAGASKIAPPNWSQGSALTAACFFGHTETAKVLVKADFNVNIPSKDGVYALQNAIQTKDVELIGMLLKYGANLHSRQAALEAAALIGFEEAIKLILTNPASLTLKKALLSIAQYGYTGSLKYFPGYILTRSDLNDALYMAADMEKKETVEKLLTMGANANARGEEYGTALQASAWDRTTNILKLLVAYGANVNEISGTYGTALQAAAFQGDTDNINFLLQSGANVNEGPVGKYGNALYAAVAGKNLEAVRMLVEHGANVNAYGGELNYAILEAARSQEPGIIRYLHRHGADIRCQTNDGGNVILLASCTLELDDLKYLHKHGADIHAQNTSGDTVLIGCSYFTNVPAVKWLMEIGVNVNAVSEDLGSALQAAAARGDKEICEILLQNGANPNQEDINNAPALIKAAQVKDTETFDILLQHGADVNYNSSRWGNLVEAAVEGNAVKILETILEKTNISLNSLLKDRGSPLHMACRYKHTRDMTEFLLRKGANPNIVGGKYHTPLQAATYKGFTSLVSSLLEHGAEKSIRGGFYDTAVNAAASQGWDDIVPILVDGEGGPATDEALHYAIHYHQNEVVETLLHDLNADVTSKGKWGNVFQALSTALTEKEVNIEDGILENDKEEDDGDKDKDKIEEPIDKAEGDDENDEENEIKELSDEEKVQQIDLMLRAAFEKKGINHSLLSKEPLNSGMKRSKSFMKVMRREASKIVREYRSVQGGFSIPEIPPVPTVDFSRFDQDFATRPSKSQVENDISAISGTRSLQPILPQDTQTTPSSQESAQRAPQNVLVQQSKYLSPPHIKLAPPTLQARATYHYQARARDEISLSQHEIVTVLDHIANQDWWRVRNTDGVEAFAPANHLILLQPSEHSNQSSSGSGRGSTSSYGPSSSSSLRSYPTRNSDILHHLQLGSAGTSGTISSATSASLDSPSTDQAQPQSQHDGTTHSQPKLQSDDSIPETQTFGLQRRFNQRLSKPPPRTTLSDRGKGQKSHPPIQALHIAHQLAHSQSAPQFQLAHWQGQGYGSGNHTVYSAEPVSMLEDEVVAKTEQVRKRTK